LAIRIAGKNDLIRRFQRPKKKKKKKEKEKKNGERDKDGN
jgi:hypothetical protein